MITGHHIKESKHPENALETQGKQSKGDTQQCGQRKEGQGQTWTIYTQEVKLITKPQRRMPFKIKQ